MSKIFSFLFFFLLFSFSPFCEEFEERELLDEELIAKEIGDDIECQPLIDLNGMPDSVVGGCVNVITGNYFESETDFATAGANPVLLSRYFNSGSKEVGELYDRWDLNLSGKVCVEVDSGKRRAKVHDRGAVVLFKGSTSQNHLSLRKEMLKSGVVNVCSPYESGRSHVMNRTVYLKQDGENEQYFFEAPGAETLKFSVRESRGTYLLSDIFQTNGTSFRFSYENFKGDFKASRLGTYNKDGALGGEIAVSRKIHEKKEKKVTVVSDDGKEIRYTISRMKSRYRSGKHRYCLTSVERSFGPSTSYVYQSRKGKRRVKLVRKEGPDGRFLRIKYYSSQGKKNKVLSLFAPAGIDDKPVLLYKFSYSSKSAKVTDAFGHQKKYRWTKQKRLSAVEDFLANDTLYRKEKFFWGKAGKPDGTLLKARTVTNGKGEILLAKTFAYDKNGNILRETLAGNLSGTCKLAPKIDSKGNLAANGCERVSKRYGYNGNNLVIFENDGEQLVKYSYYPGTDLIQLKTISNEEGIRLRYYYEYDSHASLTLEIIDDGTTADIHNLLGVSERRIKRITNTSSRPMGLPKVVSEYYFDPIAKREVLLKSVENHYNRSGFLEKEQVFDSESQLAYTREWKYDAAGRVLEETDPQGLTTYYTYDANGNKIQQQTPQTEYTTYYTYDYSNRLIKEEDVFVDGRRFVKTFAYDKKGNKVRSTDIYGNETKYVWDVLGRLKKKVLPQIPNQEGELFSPEEVLFYNELNHPVRKKDARGFVTKIETNALGNPCRIEHPTGSVETIVYNNSGTVKETTDSVGTKTLFTYDFLKRKISEEKRSKEGELLSLEKWNYSAFQLIEHIDPEGGRTTYAYDGAGRVIKEEKEGKEILFSYDSLGRQNEKKEFTGQGYRITALKYDVLGHLIEECIKNGEEKVFLKKQFAYDAFGNCTEETLFSDQGPVTTRKEYNALKLPTKIIAPDGSETTLFYRYDYKDSYHLPVPYTQTIDAEGNCTLAIGNTHQRIAIEERQNIFGKTVQRIENTYDAAGNLLKVAEDVIVDGKTEGGRVTLFSYDTMGREIALIEDFGGPCQKTTRKEYNLPGQITKIFKPDGTVIEQEWDALGRLLHAFSSDGTINYRYSYDLNNNILQAEDLCFGTCTKRVYDSFGNILSEQLDNGLKLSYKYDLFGRLFSLTLPDLSTIDYSYDEGFLKEVRRKGKVHSYFYDLSGKVKETKLMLGSEIVSYRYDACLRPIGIKSSFWSMEGEYDSFGSLTKLSQKDSGGKNVSKFSYDALNQLVSEKGESEHLFSYDSLGNRIKKDDTTYLNNTLNQLERQGETSYSYDLNGNLVLKKCRDKEIQCRYDAMDRLTEVKDGSYRTLFCYDPFHRRTKKTTHLFSNGNWEKISEERYFYQGDKEIGAANASGEITQLRVMGIGCKGDVGASVLLELNGKAYVPIHDYRGSIAILLDAKTAKVEELYRYLAFGEEEVLTAEGEQKSPLNPWRFSSKRVDPETGWLFFGRRYYDPEIGRWTTPDPFRFVDGTNLYCYVKNSPLHYIDPEGLFLNELFECIKNTITAIFEWMADPSSGATFDGEKICVTTNIPLTKYPEKKSLDHRSHCIREKGTKYGSVYGMSVNGIFNTLEDGKENIKRIKEITGQIPCCLVYNATHGLWDIFESAINLFFGINTRPVTLLHQEWNEFFDNCPEDGIIILYCHSQGAILTRNALKDYDPEKRKRIHVVAVAPGAYIDKELCGSVVHLVSKRDIVPWLDLKGRIRNRDNIEIVDNDGKGRFFDHSFTSSIYEEPMREKTMNIRENYGDLRNAK